MPAWSQAYGGPLTDDDISYLISLIRSSDKAYLQTNNLPVNQNGFSFVLASLTNPTQIADFNAQLKSGSKPPDSSFADLTSQKTVTIDAQDVSGFAVPWDWVTQGAKDALGNPTNNIKVKAGTKIIWGISLRHRITSLAAPTVSRTTSSRTPLESWVRTAATPIRSRLPRPVITRTTAASTRRWSASSPSSRSPQRHPPRRADLGEPGWCGGEQSAAWPRMRRMLCRASRSLSASRPSAVIIV